MMMIITKSSCKIFRYSMPVVMDQRKKNIQQILYLYQNLKSSITCTIVYLMLQIFLEDVFFSWLHVYVFLSCLMDCASKSLFVICSTILHKYIDKSYSCCPRNDFYSWEKEATISIVLKQICIHSDVHNW